MSRAHIRGACGVSVCVWSSGLRRVVHRIVGVGVGAGVKGVGFGRGRTKIKTEIGACTDTIKLAGGLGGVDGHVVAMSFV